MTARPDLLTPPGLGALLQALRAAGLPMGTQEVLRLHHVFALRPGLGQDRGEREQLRDLLASALTHDPDERELFEQIYRPWAERWADWARPAERRKIDDPAVPFAPAPEIPVGEETRPWWRPKLKVAARLAATALVALIAVHPAERFDGVVPDPPLLHVPGPGPDGMIPFPFPVPAREIATLWLPPPDASIEASPQIWRPSGPPLLLAALALFAGGGLFWRYGRKPWMPTVRPEPLPGPATLPLLPLAESGPELLDADSAQTLIWGVGRHLSEDLTHELDLDATVRETAAAGGMPQLRFAPEKRLREVWLWLDATVDDPGAGGLPTMERWADEIAQSLTAAGLPVRIGAFDGDLSTLQWDEGQLFRPEEVEGHRQTALVAVCTDGAVLGAELAGGAGLRALLRSLAAWPRLAFVDFSADGSGAGRDDLAAVMRRFGITCVAPAELPVFFGLGGAPAPRREADPDPGEIRAWRAALAFGGRPVDRATARAARRELGIEVSRWASHLLHTGEPLDATVPESRGGRLTWNVEGRTELAGWLAESSLDEPTGLRPRSLLDKTLDFWERRLAEEADGRSERGALDPWQERPAERHLQMERTLLRLWREPADAAEELFELASGELREEIRQRLGTLVPRDCRAPEGGRVPLPWRFEEDLGHRSRYLLAELGLGGVTRGDLRRPGRLGLALGVLAGLGLALVVLAVSKPPQSPPPPTAASIAAQVADMAPGEGWKPMAFVSLEGDVFRMGSEAGDPLAYPSEQPAHEVTVGDFWIGETEVTNAQYRVFDPEHRGDASKPAGDVTWIEARDYCRSLGEDYDLATEAEWEYAARAGKSTSWSFGDDQALIGDHAWFEGNSGIEAHDVATKKPNPWGLYDMHGNVWEWVLDCYESNAYRNRARDQPISDPGLEVGSCHQDDAPAASRVLRGGSFFDEPGVLRSAARNGVQPENSVKRIGFRCVRRPRRPSPPTPLPPAPTQPGEGRHPSLGG